MMACLMARPRFEKDWAAREQHPTLTVRRNGFDFYDNEKPKKDQGRKRSKADEAAAINDAEESQDNFDWIYEQVKSAAKERKRSIEVSAHAMTRATWTHLEAEGFRVRRATRPAPTRHNWMAEQTYYVVHW